MELINKIANIPLFDGLPAEQHKILFDIAKKKTFKRGQIIFSEGDEGIGFYIILSGKVKIFKLSAEGKEQILHIMETQEPFGEAAVFAGENYPASAQALVETKVFLFPRQSFVGLISKNPSLALNMLAFLSLRLRKLASLVEDLSLKAVPGRLAAYLLYLSDRDAKADILELDISKNQLASLIGTIPETLSRILKRMDKDKLIKTSSRRIQILDRQGLIELAYGKKRLA
jgi:CRP/FNR family transcriptional regulator, dissimilatory nitrate respiration regulator